nr:GIY-YIG nuclease family protein [Streptomyces sp. SID8377]
MLSLAVETADVTPTNAVDPRSAHLLRTAKRAPLLLHSTHEPQVYFIEHGSRVKIGYSTNLGKRISSLSLRPSAVALVLWGDRDLERALHIYFDPFRVEDSEWFRCTAAVRSYMDKKRRHEDREPVDLAAELAASADPDSLIGTLVRAVGRDRGVHLATLLPQVRHLGIHSREELRLRLKADGIRIRRSMRTREGAGRSGVHRDDLAAFVAPGASSRT